MTSTSRVVSSILLVVATTLACGGSREKDLRDSFFQQIASVPLVHDLRRNGDEATFVGQYGSDQNAKWRVRIDSVSVEANDDGAKPYKGIVTSSWYVNGQLIAAEGSESNLPLAVLDKGIAQECWAFWDQQTKRWSWL